MISSIAGDINNKMMQYPQALFIISKILPKNHFLFRKPYNKIYKSIDFEANYNQEELLRLVNSSIKIVPYYSNIYIGKRYEDVNEFENSFQFINKNILIENSQDLLSCDSKTSENDLVTTGGTSGTPTKFYVHKKRCQKEYAFYHEIWSTKGYNG